MHTMLTNLITLGRDIFSVAKSVVPILLVLVVFKLLTRTPLTGVRNLIGGVIFLVIGLFLFDKGVQMCLLPLAGDVGRSLVHMPWRPLIVVVCFIVSLVAVFAEPALKVLLEQVDEQTVGAVNTRALLYATAIGAALGMAIGIIKILYGFSFSWVIIPVVIVTLILVCLSDSFASSVAFDCATAITGPVSIPITAVLALGLASSLSGVDPMKAGFGLAGLTSLGAASAVMLVNLR